MQVCVHSINSGITDISTKQLLSLCMPKLCYTVRAAQTNGWTRDMDTFFRWLSDLKFDGRTSDNAAIAAGLADALVVCVSLCYLLLEMLLILQDNAQLRVVCIIRCS